MRSEVLGVDMQLDVLGVVVKAEYPKGGTQQSDLATFWLHILYRHVSLSLNLGSYFARDAKYSNHFTSESDVKSMFLARLLVGEYTEGSPDYVRPPHKDKGGMSLFDSCVDNVANPSIYVIFERQQIYPEYLLQYQLPKTGTGGAAAPVAVGGGGGAAAAVAFGGVGAVTATAAAVVRAKKAKSTQQSNQNATSTSQVSSIAHKASTPQQSPLQPCVIA